MLIRGYAPYSKGLEHTLQKLYTIKVSYVLLIHVGNVLPRLSFVVEFPSFQVHSCSAYPYTPNLLLILNSFFYVCRISSVEIEYIQGLLNTYISLLV